MVVCAKVGGGEAKADPVILPLDAMNFCMRPLGARGLLPLLLEEVDSRLLVERLRDRPAPPTPPLLKLPPLKDTGDGVKLGTGEEEKRGEGLRFGVEDGDGVLTLLGRLDPARTTTLSMGFRSVKSDIRVTYGNQKQMELQEEAIY